MFPQTPSKSAAPRILLPVESRRVESADPGEEVPATAAGVVADEGAFVAAAAEYVLRPAIHVAHRKFPAAGALPPSYPTLKKASSYQKSEYLEVESWKISISALGLRRGQVLPIPTCENTPSKIRSLRHTVAGSVVPELFMDRRNDARREVSQKGTEVFRLVGIVR
jgi:hypothetical protein